MISAVTTYPWWQIFTLHLLLHCELLNALTKFVSIQEILVYKMLLVPILFSDMMLNNLNLNSNKCFPAADRRAQFEQIDYTEEDYEKELEHIEQVIYSFINRRPLLEWFRYKHD